MARDQLTQIQQTIADSNLILIVSKQHYSIDAVASALALFSALNTMGKRVDIVIDGFVAPQQLSFVKHLDTIQSRLVNLQKFIIELDIKKTGIEEFSYDTDNDKLTINISPKHGIIEPEALSAQPSDYKYDLIITLDSPDLASLGTSYTDNTEFFYNTPIINIDHVPENEQYGQINLTNLTAVANAEIVYSLLNTLDKNLIDAEIATLLLTGLISKTKSFKTTNVTPATLKIASQLINAGADREIIIKHLYRSRSLATMNLWGRVLARLKSRDNNKITWSLLTEHDFVEAKADVDQIPDVIDELIAFIPGIELAVLLYQDKGSIKCIVKVLKYHHALHLTKEYKPTGSREIAEFTLQNKSLRDAEEEVISALSEKLNRMPSN